ncbi:MAG: tetratricopeptide repeat protein [Phycisphaeraceae bacterium]|nr:MAG: tetratricopeptide repeat protein [Phycisphaeraceae bacterium]
MLVKALDLGNPDVGGARASKHLGSEPSLGRSAREYFRGEWVAVPRQREICGWVVEAATSAGLFSTFTLPRDGNTDAPPAQEFLTDVLVQWLSDWDAIYFQGSTGWPDPHPSLAVFVLGRQAVIDLALRVTALVQLSGGCDWTQFVTHATEDKPGKAILSSLMATGSRHQTREGLALSIGVEKSTVDDWMDKMTVPRDINLRALAKHFAESTSHEEQLLVWLRLQWALVAIKAALCPHMEPAHLADVFSAFMCLVQLSLAMQAQVPLSREAMLFTQVLTLRKGSRLETSRALFGYWLDHQSSPLWIDDILVAGEKGAAARIQECFEVIGDESTTRKRWDADHDMAALSVAQRRIQQSSAYLIAMSPRAFRGDLDRIGKSVIPKYPLPDVLAWLARDRMSRGEHREAIEMWKEVIAKDPESADSHCHYGVALWHATPNPQFDEAIEQLKRASELRPDWDYPVAEIARVYLHRGWTGHAIQHLESAPPCLVHGSQDCSFMLALAQFTSKQYCEAGKAAVRALELDPTYAAAAHLAAECAFAMGDKAEGGRLARVALHLGNRLSYDKWLRPMTG